MRFKIETDYAIRIMLYMYHQNNGKIESIKKISANEHIPEDFASKICKKLQKCGFLQSHRGINGGYSLNIESNDLNLLDIFNCIEGDLCINKCINNPEGCNVRKGKCKVNTLLRKLQQIMVFELQKITFEKIINGD
ncbi:RrF2 family transcriptional regulator [Cetobacterium sp.]|uniref:RrF2 family transcriptional regulator n=1 Tax=Cetobacterium sp. TaxID=2071632 RepID=UPI003F399B73